MNKSAHVAIRTYHGSHPSKYKTLTERQEAQRRVGRRPAQRESPA
jgi:hypothetical protein